ISNTLISIGALDDAGYTISFGGGHGVIRDMDGKVLGSKLTVDDFHRRMGHIAPKAAKNLVAKGFVDGVELDDGEGETFCESCIFAKQTRRPVHKEREGERAAETGGKVFSDVWGPASTQ
ncbi:uncharacterized protein SCHCODRAFT_02455998, partial [Schizophyllum commune H4-8]|uniref:uncharacterized protein n=1 Tax=Schizophyllum commune (strain H4-8 / FGSC 9210) TaxID=578458 RepID=UPI00215F4730